MNQVRQFVLHCVVSCQQAASFDSRKSYDPAQLEEDPRDELFTLSQESGISDNSLKRLEVYR